jgi:L-fucose isomerase-like protein
MLKIALTRLDSGRHDPDSFERDRAEFLAPLRREFTLLEHQAGETVAADLPPKGTVAADLPHKGTVAADLHLVFIASGGSEDRFRRLYPLLPRPVVLLADGKHNSLAAALEISSWVRREGETAEIVHGDTAFIVARLRRLAAFGKARRALAGPVGIIGEPSDWLIASSVDRGAVKKRWATDFLDIALGEVTGRQAGADQVAALARDFNEGAAALDGVDETALRAAAQLFFALKDVFREHGLQAATLRCFSLIEKLHTSGCLALSRLNDEGLVCGCEGDVPAVFSMLLLFALTGETPFMANPAAVDVPNNGLLLAHCSVPRRMVSAYRLQTHFETGLGVGLSGDLAPGPATLFKAGGHGLESYFVSAAEILPGRPEPGLCRTQVRLRLREAAGYFLHASLANHHVLIRGDHEELIGDFMRYCGASRVG